jgi:hypothetical protein
MSEKDLDDLFREFGNDKPYDGSYEWKAEMETHRQARQIYQNFAQRIKNGEDCRENETKAQLTALGYSFEPWHVYGWHR